MALAHFTADTFEDVGRHLHAFGHIIGPDRLNGLSPSGHRDDAVVAVSMLLRIGGQLVSASADLIIDGRHYAGAALVMQLVEIEYLAWAFETNNEDAARWLRSTRQERESFFTPAKLRKAAHGRFRGVDYGNHRELGGHPVPRSWVLLNDDVVVPQVMLSDCLGHAERIWNHIVSWADRHMLGETMHRNIEEMSRQYAEWHRIDALTILSLSIAT
ncbi:hypothetical protein R69658_07643 [Paraburkholderia aspalathi]|uniref:AbiV family abortive infection protein n=1 Tax=Paraburkholderia aspalathi TaxID=1324617 RepID=A0ABM8T6N3_9BURK|nr:hypothetical protein [Paraburkholderia aspalathi]MBK3823940.1 hypothetical protein [Paraburkholderia aspalathi]MBK3835781.1 hypothetical protein [Paraburkholderia aspalathi]MBK3865562.1 hypothetical protein [Paraburkholderia aspalathi]CAE6861602.1 hypothetical protein R69658_07643 [Paraburkholderia aspalathi]